MTEESLKARMAAVRRNLGSIYWNTTPDQVDRVVATAAMIWHDARVYEMLVDEAEDLLDDATTERAKRRPPWEK